MKKLVLTVAASVACVAAFAQGKISFQNDTVHLAYYDSSAGALAGTTVYSANMPVGSTLVADLYMGTTSGALSLVTSAGFSASPGKWTSANVTAPYAAGTTVFLIAQVRDNGVAAEATLDGTTIQGGALAVGTAIGAKYIGWSQEFTYPLNGVTFQPMWNSGGTWAAGSQDLSSTSAGYKGAIAVSAVPEPASFALAGLGAAAALIFRRRK